MHPLARRLAPLVAALTFAAYLAPVAAHDGDHAGPGSTGPDQHSKNVKLLANVPRSAAATQSDLAFWGSYAFAGSYLGFRVLDVSDPAAPVVVADVHCHGAQGDVSVWGHLLFQSVDTPQDHGGCESTASGVTASTPGMFEGIRIFDVSNPASPVHVASISTPCGSHTHTLYPEPDLGRVLVYVASYPIGAVAQGPDCRRLEDGDGHGRVSIVNVPIAAPAAATVTSYYLDSATQWATYGGGAYTLRACHDLTAFVALKRMAAACMSEAQLWDLTDPLNPVLVWRYDNPVVNPARSDLFHSAAFSWDGSVVAFGDESGGGTGARCTDPNDAQGRIWFVDAATGAELASYKIPRAVTGFCTMHNFNFIPLRGGAKVLVSSAYTGGTTIVNVDALLSGASPAAAEIGHYAPSGGAAWSSYWYNGNVYANDIFRGVDVFLLGDKARGGQVRLPHLNPQTQMSVVS